MFFVILKVNLQPFVGYAPRHTVIKSVDSGTQSARYKKQQAQFQKASAVVLRVAKVAHHPTAKLRIALSRESQSLTNGALCNKLPTPKVLFARRVGFVEHLFEGVFRNFGGIYCATAV